MIEALGLRTFPESLVELSANPLSEPVIPEKGNLSPDTVLTKNGIIDRSAYRAYSAHEDPFWVPHLPPEQQVLEPSVVARSNLD
jgi:hypothetical protein